MKSGSLTRRQAMAALAMLTALPAHGWAATPGPKIVVSKDPDCGCCNAWVDHLRAAGFQAEVVETPAINRLKAKLGVPDDLASCHTAEIDGYVVEGHVPASAIRGLLAEKPSARGLAVPGMPIGSPGMEVEGSPPDEFTVVLFGDFGRRTYGRFRGTERLPG
jgi:hypothetical protein